MDYGSYSYLLHQLQCVESCRGQLLANRYAAYNAAVSTCVWSPVGDSCQSITMQHTVQCSGKHMCVESCRGPLSANCYAQYAAYNAAVSTCVRSPVGDSCQPIAMLHTMLG